MKAFYKILLPALFILLWSNFVFAQEGERDKGIEFYKQGKYQEATESLQKAVEADAKNQESWLYLGMSFVKLKQNKKAGKAFREADKLPLKTFSENEKDVEITSKPRPNYTDEARQNQIQGTVSFAIEFGADGVSKNAVVFQKLPYGLTENAIKVVDKIKFNPAPKDGKAVSTIKIIKYSFVLY